MIVPDRRGDSGASPRRVRSSLWAVVGVLACVSVLEPAACWRGGLFSVAASRIWMAGGALTAAAAVCHFLAALYDDFRQRKFLSLVFLAVLLSMLCALVGDLGTAELSFESTQQIAAGLRSFAAPDWNYTGKAFLGYPNRQYLVAALPSLALGRSVVALHLGYALPFLLGVMVLYAGFRKYAAFSRACPFSSRRPVGAAACSPSRRRGSGWPEGRSRRRLRCVISSRRFTTISGNANFCLLSFWRSSCRCSARSSEISGRRN